MLAEHRAGRRAPRQGRGDRPRAGGGWSPTSVPTPARASSTCTSTCSAAGRWRGPRAETATPATARIDEEAATGPVRHRRERGCAPRATHVATATTKSRSSSRATSRWWPCSASATRFLKLIESAFDCRDPGPRQRDHHHRRARREAERVAPHVRGAAGAARAGQRAHRLVRRARPSDGEGRERRRRTPPRPTEVLGDRLLTARGKEHRAEDRRAEALRGRHPHARPSRSRSGRPAPARPTWRWRPR